MPHSPITAGMKVVYQEGIYTVRAVDGNVLELEYHTGDFFRLVHASSVIVCPPPATQTAPASLPAPAGAGQGVGTLNVDDAVFVALAKVSHRIERAGARSGDSWRLIRESLDRLGFCA